MDSRSTLAKRLPMKCQDSSLYFSIALYGCQKIVQQLLEQQYPWRWCALYRTITLRMGFFSFDAWFSSTTELTRVKGIRQIARFVVKVDTALVCDRATPSIIEILLRSKSLFCTRIL